MSTRDIVLEMLISRALDKSDQRLLRLMVKRVGVSLRGMRDQGLAKSEHGTGQFMLWEIER